MNVGHRDMRTFFGKQQRHGPAVSDRIGRGVERSLPAADDQDSAALQTPAPSRFTSGLRAERTNVTRSVCHSLSHVSFGFYFGANPKVRSKRLA
jgi:hypothetical protein